MVVLQLQKRKNVFADFALIDIQQAKARIIIIAWGDCRADHLHYG